METEDYQLHTKLETNPGYMRPNKKKRKKKKVQETLVVPIIPAPGRLWQEIMSSRSTLVTYRDFVSKQDQKPTKCD